MKGKMLIADSQGKIILCISAIRKSDIQNKEILINRLEKVLDNLEKLSGIIEKLVEIVYSCQNLLTKYREISKTTKEIIQELLNKGVKKIKKKL